MAKNVSNIKKDNIVTIDEPKVYSGSFVGDLQGNADTATRLQRPFTVSVNGDALGQFSTAGDNTNMRLTVTHATESDHADHATTADHVQQAQIANHATTADQASHAAAADSAIVSQRAEFATKANEAISAGSASYATLAGSANSAKTTDHAAVADKAAIAEHAKTADRLTDPGTPVPEAEHALYADLAQRAQYDCEGKSIKDFYLKKADLPDDLLTICEGSNIFAPRKELVTQAIVRGKAAGYGTVDGNTLNICINSLAIRDDGRANVYDDIKFDILFDKNNADTTKIYVDSNGYMYLFDVNNETEGGTDLLPTTSDSDLCPDGSPRGTWVRISAPLDCKTQGDINNAINQLNNVVKLDGDQTINGKKVFTERIQAEIPTVLDDPRTVAVVHNLIDLKKQVDYDIMVLHHILDQKIDDVEDKVLAQYRGSLQFAYKDYTIVTNQPEMQVGVIYFAYFTADKQFIPYNPQNHQPIDPMQKAKYIRTWVKDSSGAVTYTDRETALDLADYMPKAGGEFTGDISTPDLPFVTNDSRVLNSKGVHLLVKHAVLDFDTKLTNYMPISGGKFTGAIGGQFVADALTAPDDTYLVKKNVIDLIHDQATSVITVEARPCTGESMKSNTLYGYPAHFGRNDIRNIKLYPDGYDGSVAEGEIIFAGTKQELNIL